MERSEIMRAVRREVWRSYDYVYDTMAVVTPVGCGVVAVITKERAHRPECMIFDDGWKKSRHCNVLDLIARTAEETVNDIVRQTEEAVKDICIC